ncbi:MAG TPA: hypothetical protein PKY05_20085 [Fibrobacteria bacterium]|nr:hypothetical protein [Fibrobacteria bacterium]
MTRQISIRIGELGKAHSVELNKAGSWLVGVFILGAIALGLGAWQVLASARIYPKLLYQKQKNSLLQERLARLRKESGSVQIEVATLDSARRLISSRFGRCSSAGRSSSSRCRTARSGRRQ